MRKKEFEDYGEPVEVKSSFLRHVIYNVDNHLCEQNDEIDRLNEEIEDLRKKAGERLNADLKAGQDMMANVLNACIGTPSVNSLGPVGATVIAKIRDMTRIEDVKEYIETIVKDNEKELKALEDDVK